MALKSMTGFGRGEASVRGWKAEVELSSVNRKQFDVRVTLPRTLTAMEALVVDAVHGALSRGHVTGTVRMQMAGGSENGGLCVDSVAAKEGVCALRRTAKSLKLADDLAASCLLALPDVVQRQSTPADVEEAWPIVQRALRAALRQLVAMRKEEGVAMQKDLTARLEGLRKIEARIAKAAPGVTKRYRQALLSRLNDAGVKVSFDDPGLLRELAVFADRSDVSEELTRLDSHFGQAHKLMTSSKPVGRALDFLCQEMFREINTIGSKANSGSIAREVIQFKAGLEAVREQIQNVE